MRSLLLAGATTDPSGRGARTLVYGRLGRGGLQSQEPRNASSRKDERAQDTINYKGAWYIMSKKFYAAFVPLLTVAAFAIAPAAAQAQAHWYAPGIVGPAPGLRVQSFSKELRLLDKAIIAPATFEVKCEVYNLGKLSNPGGVLGAAGQDKIIQFMPVNPCSTNIAGCKVAVFPETLAGVVSLPWKTELEGPPLGPFHDNIKGVAVTVQIGGAAACGALANGELEYKLEPPEELMPQFIKGAGVGKAGCVAGTTSFAEFTALTGKLTSSAGTKGEIIGKVCIWGATANQVIEVENP